MPRYQSKRLFGVLSLVLAGVAPAAPQPPDTGQAPDQIAGLHPQLVWQRTSPSLKRPDGPVLYQIQLVRGPANTIPEWNGTGNQFVASPMVSTGGTVAIGKLSIASTGIVSFAPGQTFPGSGGTVTSVTAGDGSITIGGTAAAPTVAVATGGVTNAKLANSSLTITAGSGLTGGGSVALGAASPALSANIVHDTSLAGNGGSVALGVNASQFAPASGSSNYIQNQIASSQSAGFKITGSTASGTPNTTIIQSGLGGGLLVKSTSASAGVNSALSVSEMSTDGTAISVAALSAGGTAIEVTSGGTGISASGGSIGLQAQSGGTAGVFNFVGASGEILSGQNSGSEVFSVSPSGAVTGASGSFTAPANSPAVVGIVANGGTHSGTGSGAAGINANGGGASISGNGGEGIIATGGNAIGAGMIGGNGITAIAGSGSSGATAGFSGSFSGGPIQLLTNSSFMFFGDVGCGSTFLGIAFNTNGTTCSTYALTSSGGDIFINRPSSNAIHFREANIDQMMVNASGTVSIFTLGAATATSLCYNSGTGAISACSSSIRYKKDVRDLRTGMDVIQRLRPVNFLWRNGENRGKPDLGLIAEEVNQIDPELVTFDKNGDVQGVKYDRVSVLLVNAAKEQQQTIETQQSQIRAQQQQIATLVQANQGQQEQLAAMQQQIRAVMLRMATLEKSTTRSRTEEASLGR